MRSQLKRTFGKHTCAYVLILPAFLLVVAVSIYPAGFAVYTSLHKTDYAVIRQYVGLKNYIAFFTEREGWNNIFHSLEYALGSVGFAMILGLLFALLIRETFPLRNFIKTVLFLPWVVSQVVIGLLWAWLFNPFYGVINYLLSLLGISSIDISIGNTAMPFVIAVNVWRTYPLAMILLFSAIQSIPAEFYEAAMVDGASAFKRLRYVTLPLIKRTSLVTVITLTLEAINMITLIYVITGGGPANRTATLSIRTFKTAFEQWNIGMASTVGVIIVVFNLVLSLVYLRISRGR